MQLIKMILKKIKHMINGYIHKYNWRKLNKHNFTKAVSIFPVERVTVGKATYGPLKVSYYGNENEKLIIGSYCSIAEDVKFILGGEHHPTYISNYPYKLYMDNIDDIDDRETKGPIIIEDDVWIGTGCTILSGVKIGQGAIIAAGSTVTKDVPPYAIYTTNKLIKYRFSEEIIKKLIKIDFSKLNEEFIAKNIDLFYKPVDMKLLREKRLEEYIQ